jgi:SAM-dependent methyltransferase
VSSDKRFVLAGVPAGPGRALDLGGGRGELRAALESRGYEYVNVDLGPAGRGAVGGDAHRLPFASGSFDLVVSCDSLEHFTDPGSAVREVRRVLTDGGSFVIWVPFLHPFHGTDYYRYTPLGLRLLLDRGGFTVQAIRAPLWVFSVLAQAVVAVLSRVGMAGVEHALERGAAWLDGRSARFRRPEASFAAAYLVLARAAADDHAIGTREAERLAPPKPVARVAGRARCG